MSLSSDCLEGEKHISLETLVCEDRAARTHCTWPLTRDATPIEAVRPALIVDPGYVLEEDVQVITLGFFQQSTFCTSHF